MIYFFPIDNANNILYNILYYIEKRDLFTLYVFINIYKNSLDLNNRYEYSVYKNMEIIEADLTKLGKEKNLLKQMQRKNFILSFHKHNTENLHYFINSFCENTQDNTEENTENTLVFSDVLSDLEFL